MRRQRGIIIVIVVASNNQVTHTTMILSSGDNVVVAVPLIVLDVVSSHDVNIDGAGVGLGIGGKCME